MVDYVIKILRILTKKKSKMDKFIFRPKSSKKINFQKSILDLCKINFQIFQIFSFLYKIDFVLKILCELGTLMTASPTLCEPNSETITSDTRLPVG